MSGTSKKSKSQTKNSLWIAAKVFLALLWLPTAVMIKLLAEHLDPIAVASTRYTIVALILLPFIIYACRKHWPVIRRNLLKIILISIPLAFAGVAYNMAIADSSATFVAVIGSLSPIVFAIASTAVTRDKISHHAIIGLLTAILGGVTVVILPPLLGHSDLYYGVLPIILMAFYILADVVWAVARRRQDEEKVPMPVILGIPFFVSSIVSAAIALASGGLEIYVPLLTLPMHLWLMLGYLAIVISVVSHALSTKLYEKLGTATTASLDYIYYVLAPIVPMCLIGETLSWEVAIGAVLIIAGIILTRKHHSRHYRMHRSHI